jgi:hypothetical protein
MSTGLIQSESWIGLNDRLKEGTYNWLDSSAQVIFTICDQIESHFD